MITDKWLGLNLSNRIIFLDSINGAIINEMKTENSIWCLTSKENIIVKTGGSLYNYSLLNTGIFRQEELIDYFPYYNLDECLVLEDNYFVTLKYSYRSMNYIDQYRSLLISQSTRFQIQEVLNWFSSEDSDYIVAVRLWKEDLEDEPYDPQNYSKVTIFTLNHE
ncbi:MAG: hypothetical protein K9N06_06310 [Candidatus Cloacimonetes bacterium]|nr:hypothetical protein [Candidatus Cloacimonadota bacterium]